MPATKTYWWTHAPFLRLFISLAAGILIQWYFQLPLEVLVYAGLLLIVLVLCYAFLPLSHKYRFSIVNGLCIHLMIAVPGAFLTWNEDIRNHNNWFGHYTDKNPLIIVSLDEPLVEKPASYKATALVRFVSYNGQVQEATGKVMLYFKKEAGQKLSYGSRLVISKPLEPVRNSGNPGAFDYRRYCLFQGITHQVYLTEKDYMILGGVDENALTKFLTRCRLFFTGILKKYIKGTKEAGLAEALLIGYKDDLDKELVQAYSNTGVVHVIAISGQHLALIYGLLLVLTGPVKRYRRIAWLRLVLILGVLWLFTLLAGAQPSALRASVMFSCLALGEVMARRASVYNTLALSAFVLLCIHPFWLWDAGFQLSYAAVLIIILFYRPIYNWFYFPNKPLAWTWKLVAVTLSAQILTLPVSIYHFHQFPFLFIITNLLAVPLSSIILTGTIIMCILSFITPVATFIGIVLTYGIGLMNSYIELLNGVSFAVWNGLSVNLVQTLFLFLFIACTAYWLLEGRKNYWLFGLVCLTAFFIVRAVSFIEAANQRMFIVYNVPHYQAIDFIEGRNFYFTGDTVLLNDPSLYNFHLKSTRIQYRVNTITTMPDSMKCFDFSGRKIGIIDHNTSFYQKPVKPKIDILILSKNPHIYIKNIYKTLDVNQIVIDASVPAWKAKLWKRDCDSLHLPCYDVAEKGAFVMNLQ